MKLYRVVDGLDDELVESKTAYLDAFFQVGWPEQHGFHEITGQHYGRGVDRFI